MSLLDKILKEKGEQSAALKLCSRLIKNEEPSRPDGQALWTDSLRLLLYLSLHNNSSTGGGEYLSKAAVCLFILS